MWQSGVEFEQSGCATYSLGAFGRRQAGFEKQEQTVRLKRSSSVRVTQTAPRSRPRFTKMSVEGERFNGSQRALVATRRGFQLSRSPSSLHKKS
jgi:hypothetical protein